MYAIATTHLGISLYIIFEDNKQSRAVQEIALACVTSVEVSSPCSPIPRTLQLATRARFGQVTSVLVSVNVSIFIVRWPLEMINLCADRAERCSGTLALPRALVPPSRRPRGVRPAHVHALPAHVLSCCSCSVAHAYFYHYG